MKYFLMFFCIWFGSIIYFMYYRMIKYYEELHSNLVGVLYYSKCCAFEDVDENDLEEYYRRFKRMPWDNRNWFIIQGKLEYSEDIALKDIFITHLPTAIWKVIKNGKVYEKHKSKELILLLKDFTYSDILLYIWTDISNDTIPIL